MGIFLASTAFGMIVLATLLFTILNQSFGLAAIEDTIPPASLAVDGIPLDDLLHSALVAILQDNVSEGLFRRFEHERPMDQRSRDELLSLIYERVVEPVVQKTYPLTESFFNRSEIAADVVETYPEAYLRFVSWIHPQFVTRPQSAHPLRAGVRTAILGSLWTVAITILFAFPIGVGAAIYLEEYASDNWLNRLLQTNINNLAAVPSIIYGILGLAVFVRALEPITSGSIFGAISDPTTANGRTILSAGLTLGLLILPLIIINAREAIRAVPNSLRRASYGLGATRWQTVWHHVLPNAISGILTGTILAISRALGETAPLVVVGASTFITFDPEGPFSKFTTLPIQIYQWTARPQAEFRNIAAAAILVLLVLLIALNAAAVLLRNRTKRRL
jgi:phosphate transport system permease protein